MPRTLRCRKNLAVIAAACPLTDPVMARGSSKPTKLTISAADTAFSKVVDEIASKSGSKIEVDYGFGKKGRKFASKRISLEAKKLKSTGLLEVSVSGGEVKKTRHGELYTVELKLEGEYVQSAAIEITDANGVIEFRVARDDAERLQLWKGRKGAFGALGRINTDLYVLDGVVPRTRLEETLEKLYEIAERHRITLSNVFHAGDGNLHPNVSYDGRDPDERARVLAAGREILQACVDAGGSISGEHGVGVEKSEFLPMLYTEEDLELQFDLRRAIDPEQRSNPCKLFPDARACIEVGRSKRAVDIPL